MMTVLAIAHIIFAFLLICLVLLQDPKNAGAGGMFGGGGSNSLLGSTGGATFLTRLTRYSAIAFGITCLVMTILTRPNTGSVLDADANPPPLNNTTAPAPAEQQGAPAAPAVPGAAAPAIPPPETQPAKQ
jgi:preprotein translocase subunit SecG